MSESGKQNLSLGEKNTTKTALVTRETVTQSEGQGTNLGKEGRISCGCFKVFAWQY